MDNGHYVQIISIKEKIILISRHSSHWVFISFRPAHLPKFVELGLKLNITKMPIFVKSLNASLPWRFYQLIR